MKSSQLSCEKWTKYLKRHNYIASSEFLKICSFCFATPSQNAATEKNFRLMKSQQTDERNRLILESVKRSKDGSVEF